VIDYAIMESVYLRVKDDERKAEERAEAKQRQKENLQRVKAAVGGKRK
jgi:hypothetical protein